jgi:hypothetical protein
MAEMPLPLALRVLQVRTKGTLMPDAENFASDGEVALYSPELMAGEGQIRLRPVEREIRARCAKP